MQSDKDRELAKKRLAAEKQLVLDNRKKSEAAAKAQPEKPTEPAES